MKNGNFQTTRKIFSHQIWKNLLEFRIFFLIYGNAVWEEKGTDYGGVIVRRGQYLRSYRNLQKDLEYIENNAVKTPSLSQIKKAIESLIKHECLQVDQTELGTLFTVSNYDKYQLRTDDEQHQSLMSLSVGGLPEGELRTPEHRTEKEHPGGQQPVEVDGSDSGELRTIIIPINNTDINTDHIGDKPKKQKKEPKSKKPPEEKPPTDHQRVMTHYHDTFLKLFGIKPIIQGKKDGSIVKKLVDAYEVDKVIELLDKFFACDDQFIQRAGYTMGVFYSQINKLLTTKEGQANGANAGTKPNTGRNKPGYFPSEIDWEAEKNNPL